MAVSVKRLEARGDLRKLIRGRKPALETIEADGLIARFEQRAVSPKPLDVDALAGQAADALAWTRRLSMTNARISVSLISREATFEGLHITLTPRGVDGAVDYHIEPFAMDVRDNARALGLTCRLSSSGTLRPVSSPTIEGSFSIESPRFQAPGIDEAFDGATAAMTGRLDRTSRQFTMTGLRITVPGLIDADATGNGSFASGVSAEAEVHARVEKLESLAARFGSRLPAELRSAARRGRAELSANTRFDSSEGGSNIDLSGTLSFEGVEAEFRGVRLRGGAKLTGRYELARSNETPLSRKSPPTPLLKRGVSGTSEIFPPSEKKERGTPEVSPPLAGRTGNAVISPPFENAGSGAPKAFPPLGRAGTGTAEGFPHLEKAGSRTTEAFPLLEKAGSGTTEAFPPLEKGGWGDFFEGTLDLDGVTLEGSSSGTPLHLGISGHLKATGTSNDPRVSADLRAIAPRSALGGFAFAGAEIRIVGSSTKNTADVSLFSAILSGVDLDAAPGKRISFDKLALSGKARLDLARKTADMDGLVSGIPGIAPLALKGRIGSGNPPAAELHFEGKGLDVPALRALAAPFIPEGFASWDVGGTAGLSLEARRPASDPDGWKFSGALALAQARFNDPSFTIAGEGIDPVLKLEGSWTVKSGVAFSGGLDIGSGESLWKSVYVSWSKHPLKAAFAGRYDPRSGGVEELAARFLFPTIGQVDVSGSFRAAPSPAFALKIESRLDLAPLYSLTAQAGSSQAKRMSLEGTLGASVLARRAGETLSVAGRVTISDSTVGLPVSGTDLIGLTADIPILYSSAIAETSPREGPLPEEGFIRIAELRNPILTLKPVALSLRVGTNAFAVEPVSVELFGGKLELGRTEFRVDPRTGALQGAGSLVLRELDISKFPIPPQFKLTGRVRADFPKLEIGSRDIAVSGRGEADVFGGKVVLRDLAVAEPFSPGRSISMNVDLLDLDMKKLTDEVPFGEVTGIVRGEIRGLVLSYGQPARFDFRIESVRRKGVSQTFSLKAVDNLTVLSSGQTASAGTGPFWMRFVRGFRYARLGIVSTLRNDTFTLNGTIHEGGVEYLVKKPALFGINVVNRMPDKKISFKEMTGRLKRVGQSEKPEGVSTRREP